MICTSSHKGHLHQACRGKQFLPCVTASPLWKDILTTYIKQLLFWEYKGQLGNTEMKH